MNNFPLYDTLSKSIPKKDLKVAEKNALIERIKNLDRDGQEKIYLLIKTHSIKNGEKSNIPYGGIFYINRIDFDITSLPVDLRHIINRFVSIHEKKLEEEETLRDESLSNKEDD